MILPFRPQGGLNLFYEINIIILKDIALKLYSFPRTVVHSML